MKTSDESSEESGLVFDLIGTSPASQFCFLKSQVLILLKLIFVEICFDKIGKLLSFIFFWTPCSCNFIVSSGKNQFYLCSIYY